jgi:DNA-binding transcriptional MerR regulator
MLSKGPYQKELPDKLYFKIGEVGEIAELPTYVLRFWETEFTRIKPKRTSSGQRLYSKNDVEDSSTNILDDIRSELKSIRDLLA